MKKYICIILSALLCVSCFAACGAGGGEGSTTTVPTTTAAPKKEISVLFIGNSYTYFNSMPTTIFEEIAKSAGYLPYITAITGGGWSLAQHADPLDQCGIKVATQLQPKNIYMYDYVVLQEQSMRPASSSVPQFYDAVRDLAARARAIEAKPILYCTWGRHSSSNDLRTYRLTNEKMTWKLAASYSAIGEELDIPVGYVGLAFYEVYTGTSGIELYDPDYSHPSYAGSYLAALTLFATITGVDPTTVEYNGEVPAEDAAVLKQAAKNAVFNTPEIPEEYRTSSEGVTQVQEG